MITKDRYILSGHRRHAACRLAGLTMIDCREEDVTRDDPRFEVMLREFNRQRVKSFDEVVREQVIDHNPEEAHAALVRHRKVKAAVRGDFIDLGVAKRRFGISRAKRPMLEVATEIIDSQLDYWPLDDRSIHYNMLNDPPLKHAGKLDSRYRNDLASYKDLCNLLTRARLAGEIPFQAIGDKTRPNVNWKTHREVGGFVGRELGDFLNGYNRDVLQSQPNYIVILGEKNTLDSSIRPVASKYTIPYILGRGYCSLPPRADLAGRFDQSGKEKLIVLILSDFDPEGEDIAQSFARSMRDDFGIEVDAIKVCLTWEQVKERNLPMTFDIKKNSSRYKKHARKYGDRAHEIEALPPSERSRLLEEAIRGVLDIDAYNHEVEREKEDAVRLDQIRQRAILALGDLDLDLDN